MIRSVLRLRAAAGRAGELEAFFANHAILDRSRAFPGCRDTVLLRSVDDGEITHMVIAEWDTAEDYQRWVNDPSRAALSQQLVDLLDTSSDGPIVGALFEPVEDHHATT